MSQLNRDQQTKNTLTERFRAEQAACKFVSTQQLQGTNVLQLLHAHAFLQGQLRRAKRKGRP